MYLSITFSTTSTTQKMVYNSENILFQLQHIPDPEIVERNPSARLEEIDLFTAYSNGNIHYKVNRPAEGSKQAYRPRENVVPMNEAEVENYYQQLRQGLEEYSLNMMEEADMENGYFHVHRNHPQLELKIRRNGEISSFELYKEFEPEQFRDTRLKLAEEMLEDTGTDWEPL